VDESTYVFDPQEDEWMKFPSELSQEIIQLSDEQTDLGQQIDQFVEFVDDFTVEEDGDDYNLTLHATGEKFHDLLYETIKDSLPQDLGADQDIVNSLKFGDVEYTIILNKDTYYYSDLNVLMDYEMELEGQKIDVHQDIQSTYSNHNTINEITVPQEVIDEAVEFEPIITYIRNLFNT